MAPFYLNCFINVSKPVRTTRPSIEMLLVVPNIALNRYSKRTFTDEHLKQSKNITTFKKQLKTYLFDGYYCSGIVH